MKHPLHRHIALKRFSLSDRDALVVTFMVLIVGPVLLLTPASKLDFYAAMWIGLVFACGYTRDSNSSGVHMHRCRECGLIWAHTDCHAGNEDAHTCSQCGQQEWWQFPGRPFTREENEYIQNKEAKEGRA